MKSQRQEKESSPQAPQTNSSSQQGGESNQAVQQSLQSSSTEQSSSGSTLETVNSAIGADEGLEQSTEESQSWAGNLSAEEKDQGSDSEGGEEKEAQGSGDSSGGIEGGSGSGRGGDAPEDAAKAAAPGEKEGAGEDKGDSGVGAEGAEVAGGGGGGGGGVTLTATADPALQTEALTPTTPIAGTFSMPGMDEDMSAAYTELFGSDPKATQQQVQGEMQCVVDESMGLGTELQAFTVETLNEIAAQSSSIQDQVGGIVAEGRSLVSTAFQDAASSCQTTVSSAISQVKLDAETARTNMLGMRDTAVTKVEQLFTSATTQMDGVKSTGVSEYDGVIQKATTNLDSLAASIKETSKKEGETKAKEFEAQCKSGSGLDALKNEVKAGISKDIAKQAGEAVEMRVRVIRRRQASAEAERVIEDATATQFTELTTSLQTARTNINQGYTDAIPVINAGEESAIGTLETIQTNIEGQAFDEEMAAQERLNVSEQYLYDETAAMGDELNSSLQSTGAAGEQGYTDITNTLTDQISSADGPLAPDEPLSRIEAASELLETTHEDNLSHMETMVVDSGCVLEEGMLEKVQVFDEAVQEQVDEAGKFEEGVVEEIDLAVGGFTTIIGDQEKAFQTSIDEKVNPVAPAITAMVADAEAALKANKDGINTKLEGVEAELKGVSEQVMGGLDAAIEKEAGPKVNAKRLDIVSKDIPAVYEAMDGMGTDEAAIYSTLRAMGPGHVRAFHHLWDARKKYTLKWYFEDELSGSELGIAMNYLNGNRALALSMELEHSTGFFNDDEARIEAIMRSASEDELKVLNSKHKKTMNHVRDSLGGADLHAFNALANEKVSREDAKLKADAIRLHEAMDGMGTDEDKVKAVLEGAATPEQREKLRAMYDSYAKTQGDYDGLDADLKGDFSGAEEALVLVLANKDRTEAQVAAAKVHEATDGAGTAEKDVFKALKHDKEGMAQSRATLEQQLAAARQSGDENQIAELELRLGDVVEKQTDWANIDQHLATVSGGEETSMSGLIDSEMDGLEQDIAMDTLFKGKADPVDMLELAGQGLGTDEEFAKEALTDAQGNPLSKAEIAKLNARLAASDGPYKSIADYRDQELGGKDAHEVEVLEKGKPETARDYKELSDMEHEYSTSGSGGLLMDIKGGLGISTSGEEMDHAKGQMDAKFEEMEAEGHADTKFEELAQKHPELAQTIQELGITSMKSSEAYAKSLSATVDALVTTLEIIAGVVVAVVTAGTASPVLVAMLSSLVISGTGAVLKKSLVGDMYGYDQMAEDIAKAVAAGGAGAAIGKIDKIGKIADVVGAKAGDLTAKAGARVGFDMTADGLLLNPKAIAHLQTFVKGGTKSVMEGTLGDSVSYATSEEAYRAAFGADDKQGMDLAEDAGDYMVNKGTTNFITGGAGEVYGSVRDQQKKEAYRARNADANITDAELAELDASNITWGSKTADYGNEAVDQLAGGLIDHTGNVENYKDAGKFWDGLAEMAIGSPKKILISIAKLEGGRTNMRRKLARDLEGGSLTPRQFEVLSQEMTEEELLEIGANVAPNRQPPSVHLAMTRKVQLELGVGDYYNSTPTGEVDHIDVEKLKAASPLQLAQLLSGAMDWDQMAPVLASRDFSATEKIILARNIKDKKGLPSEFLEGCESSLTSGTLEDQLSIARDIGFDQLPAAAQTTLLANLGSPDALSDVTGALAVFKGEEIPKEISDRVIANLKANHQTLGGVEGDTQVLDTASYNDAALAFAEKMGLENIDALPAEIQAAARASIEAKIHEYNVSVDRAQSGDLSAVSSAEQNYSPSLIAKALATGAIDTNNDVFLSVVHQGTTKDALEVLKGQPDDTKVRQVEGLVGRAVEYLAKDASSSELQSFYGSHWRKLSKATIEELELQLMMERELYFTDDGKVHRYEEESADEDRLEQPNVSHQEGGQNKGSRQEAARRARMSQTASR